MMQYRKFQVAKSRHTVKSPQSQAHREHHALSEQHSTTTNTLKSFLATVLSTVSAHLQRILFSAVKTFKNSGCVMRALKCPKTTKSTFQNISGTADRRKNEKNYFNRHFNNTPFLYIQRKCKRRQQIACIRKCRLANLHSMRCVDISFIC